MAQFGDEVWQDDDEVRTIDGQKYDPWRSWDDCCGSWKFPRGLMEYIMKQGFTAPTPIQAHCWPPLMDGKDVIGVAKTGSGKTLGYLLPGYIKVKRAEENHYTCNQQHGPIMLILAPTRELCQQIYEESIRFGKPANIGTACLYGGQNQSAQKWQLSEGPQCVAACPGRMNDFLNQGHIKIGNLQYLVLDEADRMLDMGFEPQVKNICQHMPETRQTALFTATWPIQVRKIAQHLTTNPTHIQVGSEDESTINKDITQHVLKAHNMKEKMAHIENVIFPKIQKTNGSLLIFTKTKKAAANMAWDLQKRGAPIVALHGDLDQRQRDQNLNAFKSGEAKVLVATDVAQRGLDIKNVEIVLNFDPPGNGEDYVHRIGRTGRAGAKGDAYTFLGPEDSAIAAQILKVVKKTGQQPPPELVEIAQGGFGGGGYGGGWGGYRGGGGGGSSGWDAYKPS